MEDNDWISTEQAAELIHVSRQAITDAIRRGSLPSTRVGKRTVLLRPADVLTYHASPKPGGWPKGRSRKPKADSEAVNLETIGDEGSGEGR